MHLLIARFQACFPRLTLMVHCFIVVLVGLVIYKGWSSGDVSSYKLSVKLDSDPIAFSFVLLGTIAIECLLIGSLLISICPERDLRRLNPLLAEFRKRRQQQGKATLDRLKAEDIEHRAFDEPPRFIISQQRGVQLSGIHSLEEEPCIADDHSQREEIAKVGFRPN